MVHAVRCRGPFPLMPNHIDSWGAAAPRLIRNACVHVNCSRQSGWPIRYLQHDARGVSRPIPPSFYLGNAEYTQEQEDAGPEKGKRITQGHIKNVTGRKGAEGG